MSLLVEMTWGLEGINKSVAIGVPLTIMGMSLWEMLANHGPNDVCPSYLLKQANKKLFKPTANVVKDVMTDKETYADLSICLAMSTGILMCRNVGVLEKLNDTGFFYIGIVGAVLGTYATRGMLDYVNKKRD